MYDFYFDDDDLRANREGRLTPNQQQRIDNIHKSRQGGARSTLIAFLIFIPALLGLGLLNEYRKADDQDVVYFVQAQLPIMCPLGGVFALIFGISAASQYLVSRAARQHRVDSAEGRAHLVNLPRNWYRRYSRYELHLNRGVLNRSVFRFMDDRPLLHFREGLTYRVYYIPYYPLPLILSAEMISSS